MNPIRKSISDEREALNAEIRKAQDKLAKLDKLEALTDDLFPESAGSARVGTGAMHSSSSTMAGVGTVTTKQDAILNAAAQILSDGIYRNSRKLLPELEARGVEVGGKNPVNNLSAYLSAAKDRFESNQQKGGWMIKQPKKPKNGAAGPTKDLLQASDELLN